MTTSYLPSLVLLEVWLFCAVEKLIKADKSILIFVHLLHHVFPHPVHLLVSLHHVILRSIRIIRFIQLSTHTDQTSMPGSHTDQPRTGVGKVRPAGQIRPASSVHPARGSLSVLTLNSARKTYRTMSDCFHAECDLVAHQQSTLIGLLHSLTRQCVEADSLCTWPFGQ